MNETQEESIIDNIHQQMSDDFNDYFSGIDSQKKRSRLNRR